jgi:hypothetical protein
LDGVLTLHVKIAKRSGTYVSIAQGIGRRMTTIKKCNDIMHVFILLKNREWLIAK